MYLGLYKNTPLHKLMTFTWDINDVRYIDMFTELKIQDEKFGRLYLPKLYLDINKKRIAELEGRFLFYYYSFCIFQTIRC